uniref:Uncharacterized protein n=1 Tax=Anguilla anguilla TaxID=7936 RepID=A0A0E9T9W0_ANGAN
MNIEQAFIQVKARSSCRKCTAHALTTMQKVEIIVKILKQFTDNHEIMN